MGLGEGGELMRREQCGQRGYEKKEMKYGQTNRAIENNGVALASLMNMNIDKLFIDKSRFRLSHSLTQMTLICQETEGLVVERDKLAINEIIAQ